MLTVLRRPTTRRYLYAVLTAAGAVAVGYGLLTDAELGLWLLLAGNVLGTGIAFANTASAGGRHESTADSE